MELLDILRNLVSIPSYYDTETSEQTLAEYICSYLATHSNLFVERQPVGENRFNIIAHDGHPPQLMFCCHMDTVPPSQGWTRPLFDGETEGDRLYGLGACDMKGGTAALLHALSNHTKTRGLFLLFDVDEEYYFRGMLRFLQAYSSLHPQLAVFPEPGMKIQNGHRGLIEVYFRVRGRTGHASRPDSGKNAIYGAYHAVEHLQNMLARYGATELGASSCNLAYLRGGSHAGDDTQGHIAIKEQANRIPDIAEVVLDIRPAHDNLRAPVVIDALATHLREHGFDIELPLVRLDYGSLHTPREKLEVVEQVIREVTGDCTYADISQFGYGEGQLLNEQNRVDCVYFGPGPWEMAHQADEFVSISEVRQASKIYGRLIEEYCSES